MARNIATSVENNFINGLVTEATALNFPENACSDTDNCVFWAKSNFTRRRGIDFESGYNLYSVSRSNQVVNSFLWQNAAGNGNNNFVVLQVGASLFFYEVTVTGALSSNLMGSTVSLSSWQISGAPDASQIEAQFSTGQGYLFVTHPYCQPFYVAYDPNTRTMSAPGISLYIRDTEGVEDGLSIDTRPSPTTGGGALHIYNTYNQGWNDSYANIFASVIGSWPSNADVWWVYKDANEVYSPALANSIYRGNSPAPRGKFLLNPFYQDRSAVSGVGGISVVTAGYYRPSTVAFFASRVFYAGVQAQGFGNKIYYSQVIENETQFGKCYQENDPGSETNFDLLATDGGTINILDCGTVIKMVSIQSSLLIFATNGVWSISGSTGTGFTAMDFTIRKLSTVPALSASSFVDVGGMPAWWNNDGIYTIAQSNQLGDMGVVSVSEKKIKQFFDDIPEDAKAFAKGYYNSLTKVVQWVYRSTAATNLTEAYTFDRILNFNTITGAFYPWSVDSSNVCLNGLVTVRGTGSTNTQEAVTDSTGADVTSSTGVVTTSVLEASSVASLFKYITSFQSGGTTYFTFSEERDQNYIDWRQHNGAGINYDSYVVSGYKVRGDAQKDFNTNYVFIFADTEIPTTFHFQGVWDYANDGDEGQYTSRQLCIFNSSHKNYDHKRLRIRGSGLSLQFRILSVDGEPFNVVGWSTFDTANASP